MRKRPKILTIAGFDPSSGAGLTADIKTFEALKCYGFGVCTANTVQNDIEFKECQWMDISVVKSQIALLFAQFSIDFVKIGIVENWEILNEIIDFLLVQNPTVKIIVDPVLKSSSDYSFHDLKSYRNDQNPSPDERFDEILSKIYLLTPNYNEIQELYGDKNVDETVTYISEKTNLFLKGGHLETAIGKDQLFTKEFTLNPKGKKSSEKHGSGCVLSSAITAQLALGFSLLKASYRGKRYTEKVLSSNTTLLGYHRI